ncbi:MAG: glutamyl-tRNA amidotransferase [Omnitrophica WOR_2 bacterium SM23_29]|nr:MAG: glutamyl-tRNA amidotransferase [Omnitrophica WOR_2 bacterium SM23_29]
MSIKDDVVRYVARLARIKLSEKEVKLFAQQLDQILAYVDKLKKLDVKDIPPTSHVMVLKNVFREDQTRPSLTKEEVLKNAPQRKNDFFKVPRIIEET